MYVISAGSRAAAPGEAGDRPAAARGDGRHVVLPAAQGTAALAPAPDAPSTPPVPHRYVLTPLSIVTLPAPPPIPHSYVARHVGTCPTHFLL